MKLRLLSIFLLLNMHSATAQNESFEGTIEFSTQQIAKDSSVDIDRYITAFGRSYTTSIKKGSYKQAYVNAANVDWVIYDMNSNRYCFKVPDKDTIFFIDCAKATKGQTIRRIDSTDMVLGFSCRAIEISSPEYRETIFYSPDLKLNARYFSQHKFMDYDLITKYCQAVYLESVVETPSLITITRATRVAREKLNDDIFVLPKLPLKQLN